MGIGTRRRAAARRRHRVHHRRQHQRRHRHHHHHRTHHNVTHVGLGLFSGQRHRPRTHGNQATMVTISTTTSSSSTSGNTRRLPAWFGCAVVTFILLAVSIVGFVVPAVPIPVGITTMFMFLMIIVVPLVSNLRTRAARREGAVDDPEAPSPSTVTGGQTVFITEMSTVDEASSANGPLGGVPVFNYDPPPSFNEAMADTASPSAPWLAGNPAQTLPGYPSTIGGTLQDPVYPPMGAPPKEEELPPPPSYDDAIRGGNTYTPP